MMIDINGRQGKDPLPPRWLLIISPFWEETMKDQKPSIEIPPSEDLKLYKLTLEQVRRIDEMLDELGEYGEVHIIVQKGELRYINKVESFRFMDREEGE
jgi:hypothetical protein